MGTRLAPHKNRNPKIVWNLVLIQPWFVLGALPVLYLRELRGGGHSVPFSETDLGSMETLLLRHPQLDKLGRTVAAVMVGRAYITRCAPQCLLSSTQAYRLVVRRPPPPANSELLSGTGLSLPSPRDRLLSSGCGSSTSVQPSFLLNNEAVCSFLCVKFPNLQYWDFWVPRESLESSSDQCWYHSRPEQQSSHAHRCLLSQRVLLQACISSSQILE